MNRKQRHKPLKILSFGAGIQSTVIYYMASMGLIENIDYAIFADTGSESKLTYDHLRTIIEWQRDNSGIPIRWVGKKSLYRDLIDGRNSTGQTFASIPAYTESDSKDEGRLRRQCSQEYKIESVNKEIRKLYGLKPNQWMPETFVFIGFSIDELSRIKQPRNNWLTFVYPLIGYRATIHGLKKMDDPLKFSRDDCISWLKSNKLPIPAKSSCVFCPFQSDSRWKDMKTNRPSEWKRAVRLDQEIRNSTDKGVNKRIYLHRSLMPLSEVNFKEDQTDLFNHCSTGHCGT